MLRSVVDTIRQLLPNDGEIKFINRFQYRALKPTWPVAFSLIFLAFAFLVPDQGRAIIKYTIDVDSMDVFTPVLVALFIGHGLVMMYTAFMLSAVTRRRQMDAETDYYASSKQDPVDPSVTLRMRYAYGCGVFLTLLFMTMAIWFDFGFANFFFVGAAIISIAIGVFMVRIAKAWHGVIADRRSVYNLPADPPESGGPLKYTFFSFLHFCAAPEHRVSQATIVAVGALLLSLSGIHLFWDFGTLPVGAWIFFFCFIVLHLVYRYYKDRVVRLHQGHTARYIIIDPLAETVFKWGRLLALIFIPLVFWFPQAVDFLGPLGVGLFGTLWATLFFSGLVESSARYVQRDLTTLTADDKAGLSIVQKWRREFRSMRRAYSWKSWFFLVLMGLLFIELLVSTLEFFRFDFRFSLENSGFNLGVVANLLIFVILIALFVFRRKIWNDRSEFRSAVNQLPSASVLAPILLLGLGEAHHIHRLSDTQTHPALEMKEHAERWVADRNTASGEPIPAIIILAEGGGIRAGAHAGLYLSHLDTALANHCSESDQSPLCPMIENTRLLDHVYSINGVSGGAVGSAVYLAGVKEELSRDLEAQDRHKVIKATLKADHLAPLFAGLFGSDILTTIFPAQLLDRLVGLVFTKPTDAWGDRFGRGVYDRADFFEDRLASVFDTALNDAKPGALGRYAIADETSISPCAPANSTRGHRTMDQTLEAITRCAAEVDEKNRLGPMVFFSTFYETGGYQMATSNVDIVLKDSGEEANCGSVPIVQQLIDRVEPGRDRHGNPKQLPNPCPKRTKTLPLSTAAHLSARFPVSNPTGVIETRYPGGRWKRHYFVDGGYMDNSGALTAIQSLEALRSAADEKKAKVNVIVLHLYALGIPDQGDLKRQSGQRATKQNEFASIPSAVLKARGAASRAPIRILCNSLLDDANVKWSATKCDKIFATRIVTPEQAEKYTIESFKSANDNRIGPDDLRYPVDPERSKAIPLNILQTPSDTVENGNPVQAAAWIPVPLEVARSDRQKNAITALLGWSLLEQTTNDMDEVMKGTAAITLGEIAESIACGSERPVMEPGSAEQLQECNFGPEN